MTISDGVTSIGNQAFENCWDLTKVTIGNGVTSIGDYAFDNCDSLAEVIISNSVTEIGKDAFDDCIIQVLYCYATTPPTLYHYKNPFYSGATLGATLYVPARCGSAYKTSDWGDVFKKIIEMD